MSEHPRILQWFNLNLGRQLRHPEGPRFFQRAEGSCVDCIDRHSSPDPSLRLKSGCARDDAIKLSHYLLVVSIRT